MTKFEVHYASDSDQAAEFSSDFQNIDWNEIGCDVSFSADDFSTLEEAVEYCDQNGVGIYYIYEGDGLACLVRVVHGSDPEVREPNTGGRYGR